MYYFDQCSFVANYFHKTKRQDDSLIGDVSSVDISTKENLKELVETGENLLKKPVSRVNLQTGIFETIENGGTNAEALKR